MQLQHDIGSFLIGVGVVIFLIGIRLFVIGRRKQKFNAYLEQLKTEATQPNKEISELIFRDKSGKLCTAQIIIDHNLIGAMDLTDFVGTKLKDMGDINKFIFSPQAVEQMISQGLAPDVVVRNMLKAAGRID